MLSSAVRLARVGDRFVSGAAPVRRRMGTTSASISSDYAAETTSNSVSNSTAHRITSCETIHNGRQVIMEFGHGGRYQLHAEWLKDSCPSLRGADFYRLSAADLFDLEVCSIKNACIINEGKELEIAFDVRGEEVKETFHSHWLSSFAPYVGKPLHDCSVSRGPLKGSGSLIASLQSARKPWKSNVEVPHFDAKALCEDIDLQVEFLLSTVVDKGFAVINGVGPPTSLERECVGKPLVALGLEVIGTHLAQHPFWSLKYDVLRESSDDAPKHAQMRTDNADDPAAGYLKWMYQAQGSVRTKLSDGLAIANHIKEHHPAAYEILTSVEVTHTSRTHAPDLEGVSASAVHHHPLKAVTFELVNPHPIIKLDADSNVERVLMSENKRAVSSLSFEVYELFMEAYGIWCNVCQDPQFQKEVEIPEGSVLICNNFRLLQGHSVVPEGETRSMCWGYSNKLLVENRFRLLRQYQKERADPLYSSVWSTRIPNQVLEHFLR